MRIVPALLVLAMAGPAAAQPYLNLQARDAQIQHDLDALRYRDVQVTNELAAAQARAQADQAVSNLQAGRAAANLSYALAPAARSGAAAPPVVDTTKLVSIPDAALAQSNARIRAAADNRR
jgi:hypothetical protein